MQESFTPPDLNLRHGFRETPANIGHALQGSTLSGGIASFPIRRIRKQFTSRRLVAASGTAQTMDRIAPWVSRHPNCSRGNDRQQKQERNEESHICKRNLCAMGISVLISGRRNSCPFASS